MNFALNHMVAPSKSISAFFESCARLGVTSVEIRNDLQGTAILDGTPADVISSEAVKRGISIISINALQRFNQWTDARAAEAEELADFAARCGARALVLVPVNDTAFAPPEAERLAGLREALTALKRILDRHGILGLVEPLGFVECSLRLKAEAVAAIDAVGGAETFRVVHDTFHHAVAGETAMFPARTGLVHISGVEDPAATTATMRDPHRVLVGPADRIDNIGQIKALRAAGYAGPLSFEPFAAGVHASPDIEADLRASLSYVGSQLA